MVLVLVVLDGLADRGKLTPLRAANTPVLDNFAKKGSCGIHYTLAPGVPVGSGIAHTLLFGYDEKDYPGRGVLEAFGAGIELTPGDIAFRINFATVEDGFIVKDRRAGRKGEFIEEMAQDLEKELKKNPFGVDVILKAYEKYRGVLIIRGEVLSPIPDMDPQFPGRKIRFYESPTGKILEWIVKKSYDVLREHPLNKEREELGLPPANIILPRGAGKIKEREMFSDRYGLRAMGIADRNLYLGTAAYFGMDTVKLPDEEKVKCVIKKADEYDFFFIHFKLTDVYGHDGKWEEKKRYIEFVDRLLEPLDEFIVLVTGDHATPASLKTHSGDPVPFLINVEGDDVERFSEVDCSRGRYGTVRGKDLIHLLLDAAGLKEEIGK